VVQSKCARLTARRLRGRCGEPATTRGVNETATEAPNQPEFRLSDAQQVAIHRRLQLVGPEVADFFHDGCAIMAGGNDLRSQTHLAAHLLREIDGRLRDVLEPLFGEEGRARIDEASKEKPTHRAEIAESGRVLRLDQQVIDLWTLVDAAWTSKASHASLDNGTAD
jgi:hypothetical protein